MVLTYTPFRVLSSKSQTEVAAKRMDGTVTVTTKQWNSAEFSDEPAPEARKQHMLGYARVSTSDQNNQRQIDDLIAFGVDRRDIWSDTASGRDMHRPGWESLWKDLRAGDLVVIHSIDRLGRDLVEVVQTVRALHLMGVNLKVLSMDIDTRTPTGMLMFQFVAAMAEWERALMLGQCPSTGSRWRVSAVSSAVHDRIGPMSK